MKKMVVIILLILLMIGAGSYFFYFMPMEKEIQAAINMPLENINVADLEDGVYQGSYTHYGVEVVINESMIQAIKVTKNRDAFHAKKAEGIISHVMEKQSLQVDLVSGATSSSKAILKAIENALLSASKK